MTAQSAPTTSEHAAERALPARFQFGKNWARFLRKLSDEQLAAARASLKTMLGREALQGRRFLDAGCGSGLFSLAARQLGANVVSFDLDPRSVACAEELRRRFSEFAGDWDIRTGSVLNQGFLSSLGEFDVVYSWGVVHHTGAMWEAVGLLSQRVAPGGRLWLAVYNDQGVVSRAWSAIKRLYNRLPRWLQVPYVVIVGGTWSIQRLMRRLTGRAIARLAAPRSSGGADARSVSPPLGSSQRRRGMRWWTDLVDWIGGWPFEVANPEDVFTFLRDRGFELVELRTCGGGLGCNEFVFRRRV